MVADEALDVPVDTEEEVPDVDEVPLDAVEEVEPVGVPVCEVAGATDVAVRAAAEPTALVPTVVVPGISFDTTSPRSAAAPVATTARAFDVRRTRFTATARWRAAYLAAVVSTPGVVFIGCIRPCESLGPRIVS